MRKQITKTIAGEMVKLIIRSSTYMGNFKGWRYHAEIQYPRRSFFLLSGFTNELEYEKAKNRALEHCERKLKEINEKWKEGDEKGNLSSA